MFASSLAASTFARQRSARLPTRAVVHKFGIIFSKFEIIFSKFRKIFCKFRKIIRKLRISVQIVWRCVGNGITLWENIVLWNTL